MRKCYASALLVAVRFACELAVVRFMSRKRLTLRGSGFVEPLATGSSQKRLACACGPVRAASLKGVCIVSNNAPTEDVPRTARHRAREMRVVSQRIALLLNLVWRGWDVVTSTAKTVFQTGLFVYFRRQMMQVQRGPKLRHGKQSLKSS